MKSDAALAYGAFELKRSYQKNLTKGVLYASLFHLLIIGGILLVGYLTREKPLEDVRMIRSLAELGPPPSLTKKQMPQISIAIPEIVPPAVGKPKPVPDEEVIEEVKFVTQKELKEMVPSQSEGDGDVDIQIPDSELFPGMNDFVPVEVEPKPITKDAPVYPDMARRSNIEGVVYLKLLIDKEGKVRDVQVLKKAAADLGFEDSAVEAAWKWTFSPAIQNGKPIAVWTTIPVRFTVK
ncbi:MAG: energy transducer TonB [candidate division Zixibacteria bacterium]|nr:energy transducer TonB [candidate division Zixibacteria bacterium]